MPHSTPSRRAASRAVSIASSSSTAMISSSRSRSSTGGTKPAPMPWILCGPGRPPDSTGRRRGLDGDHLDVRVALLQERAGAGDRPAGADAGDEVVDLAVQRLPQLRAGRAAVDLRVGRVGELVGQEDVVVARHRARGGDGLVHAAHRLGDVHLRAVEAQQALALAAHALRQREDQLVALGGAHERERDAGVAAGGLDDRRAAGLDPALLSRPPRSSPRRSGP